MIVHYIFEISSCYHAIIKTLEGIMRASLNDYIIFGVKNELYDCKPDVFEKTYEVENASE